MTYEYSYLTKTTTGEFKHTTNETYMLYSGHSNDLKVLNRLSSEGWRVIKIERSKWWLEREVKC